ncbi:mitochondrial ribosomal protein S31 [Lycorma delicatula]|uniref:mitochondrial ribosomal protein S31 n=1 Tax=Lycorma delicatula TaxID=130591 RepID=UPI003F511B43
MTLFKRFLIVGHFQTRRSLTSSLIRLTKRKDETSSSSDSDSSSSDDEKKVDISVKKSQNEKAEAATDKLNALLKRIMQEEKNLSKSKSQLNLAKPREIQRQKELEEREKHDPKIFDEKLVNAARHVADNIGGDSKQTEADLLSRLLYKDQESVSQEDTKASKSKTISSKTATKTSLGSVSLNELLVGMKIDRIKHAKPLQEAESRADQVRKILVKSEKRITHLNQVSHDRRAPSSKPQIIAERVNLFGAESLGIFNQVNVQKDDEIKLEILERCVNRELKLAVMQPPTNIYEQMILWTEKGILWHFPIDNEQGLEEEKKVYFSEHVHLEKHLEGWCPTKGPIRHFMELVCVGLSKNSWLTVNEKVDHICWFRDFFRDKAALIKEIGAGDVKLETRSEATQ